MPRPRPVRFNFGKRKQESIQAEVLYLGKHAITDKPVLVVGLDNSQAAGYLERGFNVKVKMPNTRFMGQEIEEPILYLQIDIPESFDESILAGWRLNSYVDDSKIAVVEFESQPWWISEKQKSGVRLRLTEIYTPDDEPEVDTRTGFEVLKDLEKDVFNDYETYVQAQRDACMPVWSRQQWQRFYQENARPGLSQRDYENLNNRQRTTWVVGEKIGMFGCDYIIASVTDLDDQWGIRADRKYCESLYFRVPK